MVEIADPLLQNQMIIKKFFSFLYFIAQNYLYDCNCHLTFRKSLICINCATNLTILKLHQLFGSLLNTTPFLLCISFHSILKKEDKKNVCNDLTKDSSIILWNVLGFPSFVTWASTPYMLQYIAAKVQFRLGLFRPTYITAVGQETYLAIWNPRFFTLSLALQKSK